MGKFRYHHRERPMKISIELNRSDLQVLAAIFLLMLPDYGALRGVEAGGSLLYLINLSLLSSLKNYF